MATQKTEAFYARLIEGLYNTTAWPSDYLFKFIVPTNTDSIKRIHGVFDNTGAVIELKESKTGKYTSLSVTVNLKNPEEVVRFYKEVGAIDGVISL